MSPDEATDEPRRRPTDTRPLLPWTLSFLRPYRGRVVGVASADAAADRRSARSQPWPLKIVIDYVLGQHDAAEPFRQLAVALTGGGTMALLVLFVVLRACCCSS